MNSFDNYILDFLNESIIDIPRNSLDPTVFQFPEHGVPIMHPIIKTQIMNDVEKFQQVTTVVRYFVVGSILTKNYTPHSDIDVNVQIDAPTDRVVEAVFDIMKQLNGRMAAGTTHPINYFVIKEDYNLDKTDAAYDVVNETWIKEPENVGANVQNYMNKFQTTIEAIDFSTNELRRDIIDLEELKSMDVDEVKNLKDRVEEKIKEIENDMETVVATYRNIRTLRKHAFDRDMTPTEIRKYGKRNKLPENVIYKMIERYYYFDFMNTLKGILKDDVITSKEIQQVKKAGKDLWK